MLSICLPVFNYDVRQFVYSLNEQIDALNITAEIIVYDDGSNEYFRNLYRDLLKISSVRLYSFENKGRSHARNELARLARFNDLIFLDCDCLVKDNFLETYLHYPSSKYPVVIGGITYPEKPTSSEKQLRWKYGVERETTPLNTRRKNPYRSFSTVNFKINRKLFRSILFDESLSQYGHEDTLFGLELMKRNISLHHIVNPVIHYGIDVTKEYLDKTKQSIDNLIHIAKKYQDPTLHEEIKLLYFVKKIKYPIFVRILAFLYTTSEKSLTRQLKSKNPSLLLLDLYKLGYFCLRYSKYHNN
ncbi:glycosyltransferase family 2 protein [Marinilabiliaceae bacterium JC017]|nr:glycosyltransferase family 2 protein [Marinilabiliaceae bacterium JC017]